MIVRHPATTEQDMTCPAGRRLRGQLGARRGWQPLPSGCHAPTGSVARPGRACL